MKQGIKILLLFIIIAISAASTINAQSKERRMSREELAVVQAKHIAGELALNEDLTQKFIETYCDFQKELWALGPRAGRKGSSVSVSARFDHSQKILDLRKKYYAKYRTFLSEAQVEKVYEIEHRMMQHLSRKAKHRVRLGKRLSSADSGSYISIPK